MGRKQFGQKKVGFTSHPFSRILEGVSFVSGPKFSTYRELILSNASYIFGPGSSMNFIGEGCKFAETELQ